MTDHQPTVLQRLDSREDLSGYGSNAIALFALELRFSLDDIRTVADEALTDDKKDHKCDLLYVDRERGIAVIAQAYAADDPNKSNPPANKAADLNTALSWILDGTAPSNLLGEKLQAAAVDLRAALRVGEVTVLEVWFIHNLAENVAVNEELRQVEQSASAQLARHFAERSDQIEARTLQVSRDRLDAWYRSTSTAILVAEEFTVPASHWFTEAGDGWEAVCTSVPATWLHELYGRFGDELFSANVRGPIPARRSRNNINFTIGETAKGQPRRFWAYNNGITALVNGFEEDREGGGPLKVRGMAIVNGAQTTGALGRVPFRQLNGVTVLARFVKSADTEVVNSIIRFNNSQNPIKPSDFRSRDPHQDRLREEFKKLPDVTYLGARRGGGSDAAKKPSNYISSDTAAQSLAAVHGDPVTAYNDLRLIWERDDQYSTYFADHTTATHIVFCFALLRSVQEWKADLVSREERLTASDKDTLSFLRKRGSTFLLVTAVASSLETIMDRAIPSSYRLSFGSGVSPATAVEIWTPIVTALGAFAGVLDVRDASTVLRRNEKPTDRLLAFQRNVAAVKGPLQSVFQEFAGRVSEDSVPSAR